MEEMTGVAALIAAIAGLIASIAKLIEVMRPRDKD